MNFLQSTPSNLVPGICNPSPTPCCSGVEQCPLLLADDYVTEKIYHGALPVDCVPRSVLCGWSVSGFNQRLVKLVAHLIWLARETPTCGIAVSLSATAALMAGCLPIYLGTPNIAYFLPHPDSALVFQV